MTEEEEEESALLMAGKTLTAFDSSDLFHTALTGAGQRSQLPLLLPPIPSTFPHSKLIPNTRFAVDAFRHAGDYSVSYFLSHFHSDHYTGLSPAWSHGLVFCSPTTARLLKRVLCVPPSFVVPLPLRRPLLIDGCEVVLVDANHCPGAVQFLFTLPSGERYVHTGDFRFCSGMLSDDIISRFVGCDAVLLDTTYCDPKYVFPSQDESIDHICSVIESFKEEKKGLILFLVATYVIGKEKILLEIARRCERRVCVDARKMEVLSVLGLGEGGVFTEDESESDVHVVGWNVLGETWPFFKPNFGKMEEIMVEKGYSRVVGFVPTGWTYKMEKKFVKDAFEIHLVPYSEHSNYEELREYVRFLKPKRVIPTVGSDVEKIDSKNVSKMQKHFAGLVDEMANKKEFLKGFHRGRGDNDDHTMEEATPSDVDTNVGSPVAEVLSPIQEPDSQTPMLLTDEKEEEIIQELRDCLPSWVTRQQMLELIRSSRGDIVEAVSQFYDRETEFRGEGIASTSAVSVSETSAPSDTASLTKAGSAYANIDVSSTPDLFPPKQRNVVKSGISPAKRGKKTSNKVNKKIKLQSKLDSCGPKQATITRFFSKVLPDVTESGETGSTGEQIPEDEKLPDHFTQSYKDVADQFLQIIDGNESLKSYAETIIQKTNGDISMAVDIHYSNNEGRSDEIKLDLVADTKSVQSNSDVDNCTSNEKKVELGKIRLLADSSVHLSIPDNAGATSVSLPPETYNPVEHACWSNGQHAPYLHLARTFDLLEDEKGKIKATSMLCNMFRSLLALSPDDVLPAVYLCTNKIAADHKNVELNIGGSLVTGALEDACGTSRSKIRDMYNELGDLGDVAQACRQTQSLLAPPSPLLIKDVFSALWKISVQTGSGSSARKRSLIVNLMRSCREKEMKFLVRTLVRNLRIGAMMKTVLAGLAQAVVLNSFHSCNRKGTIENLKEKLERHSAAVIEAYNVLPNLDLVVPSLMKRGIGFSSSTLSMVPGTPIKPMLARITNGVQQALKLFENKAFTCEYKYDGQRAQIHKLGDGSVHVFSRNGDETTSKFPDLINIINQSCKPEAVTFILDAEVVGIDRKNGYKLMSFQELSSRGRGSRDASILLDSIKVDICVFVFDIMFANGQQLLSFPLRRRRKYLKDMFQDEKYGYFEYAKEMTVEADDACSTSEATLTRINSFFENAFVSSCEGIMVKCLDVDAGYSPSKRTDTWLKVKRDYMEGLGDTLDLVPIGAWHGNGRKAGWYSPFLMACYNPETEEFQSVCRVMSGFSDVFYTEMKSFYSGDKILAKKPPYYRTAEVPDMWFSPELVWEIRGADFTVSPVHQAAIGFVHPSRGISIRFPRYIRTVTDRKPDECSTGSDIAEMFRSQTRKMDVASEDGS